jgi:hypothetical protein
MKEILCILLVEAIAVLFAHAGTGIANFEISADIQSNAVFNEQLIEQAKKQRAEHVSSR